MRGKMKEKMKRDRGDFFFLKNLPDELAQNVSKKIPFRRIIPSFFPSKVQNLAFFELFT